MSNPNRVNNVHSSLGVICKEKVYAETYIHVQFCKIYSTNYLTDCHLFLMLNTRLDFHKIVWRSSKVVTDEWVNVELNIRKWEVGNTLIAINN